MGLGRSSNWHFDSFQVEFGLVRKCLWGTTTAPQGSIQGVSSGHQARAGLAPQVRKWHVPKVYGLTTQYITLKSAPYVYGFRDKRRLAALLHIFFTLI